MPKINIYYDPSEVVASFDFVTRIKQIREKVNKPSRHDIENFIDDYSNEQLTKKNFKKKLVSLRWQNIKRCWIILKTF